MLATGFVAPLALCLILLPLRDSVPNTSAALLLVLALVGVASAGDRLAGLLAALSAGLGFDFFLTQPYESLSIASAVDGQTALLLLGMGAAVIEIAYRGREQHAMASKRLGYLGGVEATAKIAAGGSASPSALIERVGDQIVQVMGLEKCRFDYGTGLDYPRLEPDGNVRWRNQSRGRNRAGDTFGLPVDKETELVVESEGRFMGRFLLRAHLRTRRSRSERMVAAALVAHVGAILGATATHVPPNETHPASPISHQRALCQGRSHICRFGSTTSLHIERRRRAQSPAFGAERRSYSRPRWPAAWPDGCLRSR